MAKTDEQDRIRQALDLYYCREMLDEPVSDDELLERIVNILEGVKDAPYSSEPVPRPRSTGGDWA